MKEDAILINTARGGVVHEQDLVDALRNKKLRAAGVDVFRQEPAPKDHPFLSMDEITKTPHMGGISLEAAQGMSTTTATNLVKAIKGEKVDTIVNWDAI